MKIWVMHDTIALNIRRPARQISSIEMRRAKKNLLLLGEIKWQFKSFYFCDCTYSNLTFSEVCKAEIANQIPVPKSNPTCIHQTGLLYVDDGV